MQKSGQFRLKCWLDDNTSASRFCWGKISPDRKKIRGVWGWDLDTPEDSLYLNLAGCDDLDNSYEECVSDEDAICDQTDDEDEEEKESPKDMPKAITTRDLRSRIEGSAAKRYKTFIDESKEQNAQV